MTAALPARLRDCMRSLPRPRVPHAIVPAALGLLLAAMATGCGGARHPAVVTAAPEPEAETGFVSSAHPLATEAGLEVLRRGGSAIDAAIAVQAMLGLVVPQSSGLAGGAILLHYDAATRRVDSYIGRERSLTGETVNIVLLDTCVAVASGLIIFPACFAFDVRPDAGPGLLFITLPAIFNQMAGGRVWARSSSRS